MLPEDFLYRLLPPGVSDEDKNGVLRALVGGFQDSIEDVRYRTGRLGQLLEPGAELPEQGLNRLAVRYSADGGGGKNGSLTRLVDSAQLFAAVPRIKPTEIKANRRYAVLNGTVSYDGSEYKSGTTFTANEAAPSYAGSGFVCEWGSLLTFVEQHLELDPQLVLQLELVTDQRGLLKVWSLPYLAASLGAQLHGDDIALQRLAVQTHLPRLKIKGTGPSYERLGSLLGFDSAKLTPLWSRLSPRSPGDIGAAANDPDFSYRPEVSVGHPNYDPWAFDDGEHYLWEASGLSHDPESELFYVDAFNGKNPYVVVEHAGRISSILTTGTTALVSTDSAHGLVVGHEVCIRGTSQASYDGNHTVVAVLSSTTFQFEALGNPGDYDGSGEGRWSGRPMVSGLVSSLSHDGLTASALTPVPHGLVTGAPVTITGASEPEYNITARVTVTSQVGFKYELQAEPAAQSDVGAVWSSSRVSFTLSGGAPNVKASAAVPGTALVFTALAEGTSYNGLPLTFSIGVDGKVNVELRWRLSSLKYRSSYFDLSLSVDRDKFESANSGSPVTSNEDARDVLLVPAPYRPLAEGKYTPDLDKTDFYLDEVTDYANTLARRQARETRKQFDTDGLGRLALRAGEQFDLVRTATRRPRRVTHGAGVSDQAYFAPIYSGPVWLMVTTSVGLPATGSGTVLYYDNYKYPIGAKLVVIVSSEITVTRSVQSQSFRIASLSNVPVVPGSVSLWEGATMISDVYGADLPLNEGRGDFRQISGKISGGTINYSTGEITLDTESSYAELTLTLKYHSHVEIMSEVDPTDSDILLFGSTKDGLVSLGAGSYLNLKTRAWSLTLQYVHPSRSGMLVAVIWHRIESELIRTEPHPIDKYDLSVDYSDRPEDEIDGLSDRGYYDQFRWRRDVVGGGELIDVDSSRSVDGIERSVAIKSPSVVDQHGVELNVLVLGSQEPYRFTTVPVQSELVPDGYGDVAVAVKPYDEWNELTEYVVGDRVSYRGRSLEAVIDNDNVEPLSGEAEWRYCRPTFYHVGLRNGVLVADPDSFYSAAHRDGLVCWFPFNEHPRDHLVPTDRTSNVRITLDLVSHDQRRWDASHGWGLRISGLSWLAMSIPGLGKFSLSFWAKFEPAGTGSALEEEVFRFGSLSFRARNDTLNLRVYWMSPSGAQLLGSMAFISGQYCFFSVSFDGDSTTMSGSAGSVSDLDQPVQVSDVTVLSPPDTPAGSLSYLVAGRRPWSIRDLRVWRSTKTTAEFNQIRRPRLTPTIVEYSASQVGSDHGSSYTLEVLENGLVVPSRATDDGSSVIFDSTGPTWNTKPRLHPRLVRVPWYRDDGSFIGQDGLKFVGMAGSQDLLGSAWPLGRHFYQVTGLGLVPIATDWKPDWICDLYSSESGASSTLGSWSLGRDSMWLDSGGELFKVNIVDDYLNPELARGTLPTGDLGYVDGRAEFNQPIDNVPRYTTAEKVKLSMAEVPVPEISIVGNGTHKVGVHDVAGVWTSYVEGLSSALTTPVYLYKHSERVCDVDQSGAYSRWDAKNDLYSEPRLLEGGSLDFTNPEPLTTGYYKLVLDVGNSGTPDPAFSAFQLEVSVNGATIEAAASSTRSKTTITIPAVPASAGFWPMQIRWTNYEDVSIQGYQRQLVVYGYRLERIESRLQRETHDSSTITVEDVALVRTSGSLSPGAWLGLVDSDGQPAEFKHEIEKVEGYLPLANVLTWSTNDRADNVMWVSPGIPSVPDPAAPDPLELGAVGVSGGPSWVAGDVVSFVVGINSGSPISYLWELTHTGGVLRFKTDVAAVVGVKLPQGTVTMEVTATDQHGQVDTASLAPFVVSRAPRLVTVTVTVNDAPLPFTTSMSATTDDVQDTITWYAGPGETNPIATPLSYVVTQSKTVLVVAESIDGAKASLSVDLRGLVSRPPVSYAFASHDQTGLQPSRLFRIGPGRSLWLHGQASDSDMVGQLAYAWSVLGLSPSGSMTTSDGRNYKAAPYQLALQSQVPGKKVAEFTATDGSGKMATAKVEFELVANRLPVISEVKVLEASTGQPFVGAVRTTSVMRLRAEAADPDGDNLSYSWFLTDLSESVPGNDAVVPVARQRRDSFSLTADQQQVVLAAVPVLPGSVEVTTSAGNPATDDGKGNLRRGGTVVGGTIDYSTGRVRLSGNFAGQVSIGYKTYVKRLAGVVRVDDGYGGIVESPLPRSEVLVSPVISSPLYVEVQVNTFLDYRIESTASNPLYTVIGVPPGASFDTDRVSGYPSVVGIYQVRLTMSSPDGGDSRVLIVNVTSTTSRPLSPLNLRAFNDGVNPRYTGLETAIELRWTVGDDTNGADLPATRLEFRTLSDQLVDQELVPAGVDSFSYAMERLLARFGTSQTFMVRAYHEKAGVSSLAYDYVRVTKI